MGSTRMGSRVEEDGKGFQEVLDRIDRRWDSIKDNLAEILSLMRQRYGPIEVTSSEKERKTDKQSHLKSDWRKLDEDLRVEEGGTATVCKSVESDEMKKRLKEMEVCRAGLLLEENQVEGKQEVVLKVEEQQMKREFMVGMKKGKQMEETGLVKMKKDIKAEWGVKGPKDLGLLISLDQITKARNGALKEARWVSYTANIKRPTAQFCESTRKPQNLTQYEAPMGVHSTQLKTGQPNSHTPEAASTNSKSHSETSQPRQNLRFKRRLPAEVPLKFDRYRSDETYGPNHGWRFKQLRLLLMDNNPLAASRGRLNADVESRCHLVYRLVNSIYLLGKSNTDYDNSIKVSIYINVVNQAGSVDFTACRSDGVTLKGLNRKYTEFYMARDIVFRGDINFRSANTFGSMHGEYREHFVRKIAAVFRSDEQGSMAMFMAVLGEKFRDDGDA